jgi:hypothetical protein
MNTFSLYGTHFGAKALGMNGKAEGANSRPDNIDSHPLPSFKVGDSVKLGSHFGEVVKVLPNGHVRVRTEDGRVDIYNCRRVKLLSRTES